MASQVDLVRLAYMARELPPADDNAVFNFRPDIGVIHAMRRHTATDPVQQPKQQTVQVYTMEGRVHEMTVTPGVTTAGEIRTAVAAATGANASEVRLHYAGRELDPSCDRQVMDFKPNVFVLHTMKRMTGGGSSSSSGSSGSKSNSGRGAGSSSSGSSKATFVATTGNNIPLSRRKQKPEIGLRKETKQASVDTLNKNLKTGGSSTAHVTSPESSRLACDAMSVFDKVDNAPSHKSETVRLSSAVTAPGAGSNSGALPAATAVKLAKQFRDLLKHPIPGVSAAPDDDDPLKWHVKLAGPEDTPYAGGWFHVELHFPSKFPGYPPSACFVTKIWHPNIDEDTGRTCVDIGGNVCSVGCVLSALQQLLKHPNPEDPRNHACALEMLMSTTEYLCKARAMTQQHAMNRSRSISFSVSHVFALHLQESGRLPTASAHLSL